MKRSRHLTAIAGACLAVLLAGCTGGSDPSAPSSSSSGIATSSTSTPATTSSSTPLTEREQATKAAEATYLKFVADYTKKATHYQSAKLDQSLITPALYKRMAASDKQFIDAGVVKEGGTAKYIHETKDLMDIRFEPGKKITLQVCALVDTRYLNKNGEDKTISRDGKPLPQQTEARAKQVTLISTDNGATWKVDNVLVTSQGGAPC